jgi:cell filamentation protein
MQGNERERTWRGRMRYGKPAGAEGDFEPGSRGRVLANLKGITDPRLMDEAEFRTLIEAQQRYYATLTPDTPITAQLICQMHRDWLGSLYAWAGQYRNVELQKDNFAWPPAWRVPDNMAAFERETLSRYTPCRPGLLPQVADALAHVHAELLLIHPFRDGNGRLTRWLTDIMAVQAGYPVPDYGFTGRGSLARRNRYIATVSQGYAQNYEPLAAFFVEAIERRGR